MFSTLLKILTSRLFWGFIGITLIALIIWFAGPFLAFNDYHPLETDFSRIVTISVIYGIWILWKVIPKLYSIWFNNRLLNHLSAAQEVEESPVKKSSIEDDILRPRFNEALEYLKKARMPRADGSKHRWYDRFTSQHLYQLPWYVIIGAPGAGKTTALVNSGLHFPLAEQYGKAALRGVGGTRNCDWWFTNDAILLDTAGRYTTQESQREEDSSEWLSFVKLLKTFRSRQPINGIIVTISIQDLLKYSPEERRTQATALRKRLSELNKEFSIYFPVYVWVTKADLLTGFSPYFATYDKARRRQIWGFTFPFSETQLDKFNLLSSFDKEYELLQQRIDSALMDTMQKEIDLRKRAEIYLFPQKFALLKGVLRQYLEDVFPASAFERSISPRGVYFTSGTQTTFEEMMVVMRDNPVEPAGIQPIDSSSSDFAFNMQSDIANKNDIKGNSYFITDLLQNVIFREAGLAGNNRWWEYRNRALHWAGYGILATCTIVSSILWFNSYNNNYGYIDEVSGKVVPTEAIGDNLKRMESGDLLALLPYLNALIGLPTSREFDIIDPPYSYQLGLYRGNQINNASNGLYQKALRELLMPQVARLIENILFNDSELDIATKDPDFTHGALKAYLMLYKSNHYDGEYLQNWIMDNIKDALSSQVTIAQREQIKIHLYNILTLQAPRTSPFIENKGLVEKAQIFLNQAPLDVRVYSRLKHISLEQATLHEISLSQLAGMKASSVFKRKSGKPLTSGVSGLFTTKGYWNVFDKNFGDISDTLYNESIWMLNSVSSRETNTQLNDAVRKLYVDDFIYAWKEFLSDIELVPHQSNEQLIRLTQTLSDSESPMKTLAINLAEATSLKSGANKALGSGAGKTILDTMQSRFSSRNPTLGAIYNSEKDLLTSRNVSPEEEIEQAFKSIHHLGERSKESTIIPLDESLAVINETYTGLIGINNANAAEGNSRINEIITKLKATAGRLPNPFNGFFYDLASRVSDDVATIKIISINKELKDTVSFFCNKAIGNRYPLSLSARQDIAPDDLAAVFAPQTGSMDRFTQVHLRNVNYSASVWSSPVIGGQQVFTPSVMASFKAAKDIQNALFSGGGPTPSFKVTVTPVKMDSEILNLTLDINGQIIRYSHGPQIPAIVEWPGNRNSNQVNLHYSLVNGSPSNLTASGFWALHKMVMVKQASRANVMGSNDILLTFTIEGRKATIKLSSHSVVSPFKLPPFSCP